MCCLQKRKKNFFKLTIKLELPFNPMSWYVIRVGFRVSPPCRVTKIFPLEVWSHSSCREPSLVFPSVRPLAKRGRVPLFRAGHDPNSAYVLEDDWNLRLCTTCNGGKKNYNKSENRQTIVYFLKGFKTERKCNFYVSYPLWVFTVHINCI